MEGFYLENLQKKTHNLFGIFNANLTKIFGHQQFKMNYFVGIIMLNIQMQSALCFVALKVLCIVK
jgi:hypothetical protein